jgi:hypothetical protein
VMWFDWWPDPTRLPQPRLLFIPGKTFATPPRLIQFLALVAVFSVAFPYIQKAAPRLVDLLSMCGRNALAVFCMGSLLSLAGQITRFVYRGDIIVDTAVVVIGVAIMVLTAWLTESRDRTRPRAPAPQPSSSAS